MKHKGSEPYPKDPLKFLQASSLRAFHGPQNTDSHYRSLTTSQGSRGITCRKREKCMDIDLNNTQTCRPNASPVPLRESQDTRIDKAKTSEYAFYKKLKKDASSRFDPHAANKKEQLSKKFKSSDCLRERYSPINNSSDFRSSLLTKNATPVNFDSLPSNLGNASKIKGTHQRVSKVFYAKRKRLRRFVREVTYPEISELKRYDFVSVLLSRLIPESSENRNPDEPTIWKLNTDTKSNILPSARSDIHFNELQWLPSKKSIIHEYGPHISNNSSTCVLNRSKQGILSNSNSSASTDNKVHLEYRTWGREYDREPEKNPFSDESGSVFSHGMENLRPATFSHFKELDNFYDQDETLLPRERNTLLLDWFNTEDERKSPITYHSTGMNLSPEPSTSWSDDYRHNFDNSSGAFGLCSSFLSPSNGRNISSVFCPVKASSYYHGNGRHVPEEMEDIGEIADIAADFNHNPLTFSCAPDYLTLSENHIDDKGQRTFLPPQSCHWFMSKLFNDGNHHHLLTEALSSSGINFDLRWKQFSGSDSSREPFKLYLSAILTNDNLNPCRDDSSSYKGMCLSEENVVHEDNSSFYFQTFLGKEKNSLPLLLDKSSWDEAEE